MALTGFRHEEEIAYVVGVDLGQSSDPTAICVLEHRKTFHHHFTGRRSLLEERFDVRHLARLPLQLSYPAQVQEVARLLARPPLANCETELVIDETGVGRAVADLFDIAGLNPTRLSITAGSEQTQHGSRRWHTAKQILISILDARLHTGELKFAAELLEAHAMAFAKHSQALRQELGGDTSR